MKILGQRSGGLGDNLIYTTLPERFAELGISTYISSQNVVRNQGIHDLVWGVNPFIKGVIDEPPNMGDISFREHLEGHTRVYSNEWSNELEPINELPRIYYRPTYRSEFKDTVVVDISSYTTTVRVIENLDSFLKKAYPGKTVIKPVFKGNILLHYTYEYEGTEVLVDSIFDYVDMIHSCAQFVCWFSGQSVLASAIDKQDTLAIIPSDQYVLSGFMFPNITYKPSHTFTGCSVKTGRVDLPEPLSHQ